MRTPVAPLALLLAACASPGTPARNELVERAELQDAWLATVVPFGLAALLVLAVIVMRHERGENASLRWLFESHRLPDVGRWWSERKARLARERAARRAARAAELERQRTAPAPPPLGPSTLGAGRRFLLALAAHGVVFAVTILHVASGTTSEWTALVVVVLAAGAAIVSIVASGLCALAISALPRRHPAIATVCGVLSTVVVARVMPLLADVAFPAALAAGAFAGLLVGGADEDSRKPLSAAPDAGGPAPTS